MQASRKDFAHQCIVPYVEGHELPEVHDVVKRVTRPIVHYEFGHLEPSRQFITNYMGAKWRGEHIIQLSTDKVRQGLRS